MEREEVKSRGWVLTAYAPRGNLTSQHLELRETILDVGSLPENHVAVKALWISVDPYLRAKMYGRDVGLCAPQCPLNHVVTSYGIGEVLRSNSPIYGNGDIVLSPFLSLSEYSVAPAEILQKVDSDAGIPLHEYLGTLGIAGFSAWVGLNEVGQVKACENVFISAAAGAVGTIAGQLAKIKGCRVIGSAGTDEKVKLLKEELGYDDAFNYKKEKDFDAALSKYFPDGIDVYLDNVGGKMLEAVLNHINNGARIPISGMVSQYTQVWTERDGVRNLLNLVGKEAKMQGFLIGSYLHLLPVFTAEMIGYMKQGKLKTKHKIYLGIEYLLESLNAIFSGINTGKVAIKVL
ncbi:2-alkenal reductase [Nymphaea thermarum]|nr:2-alkenal reductase [Nymphaea thermarum]